MGNRLILEKHQGQLIPVEYLELVEKQFKSASGLAFVKDSELHVAKIMTVDITELAGQQEQLEQYSCIFSFHNFDGEFEEKDIQPYVISSAEDDTPQLVCFIDVAEGDPADIVDQTVIPTIGHLVKYVSQGSLQKLLDTMRSSVEFKKDMSGTLGESGQITFLAASGEMLTYQGSAPKLTSFKWGWTSDNLGYGEHPEQAEQPAAETPKAKKPSLFAGLDKGGDTTKVGETTVVHAQKKDDADSGKHDMEEILPPPAADTNNKLRDWYIKRNNGVLPTNWKNRPAIFVRKKLTNKDIKEAMEQKGKDVGTKFVGKEVSGPSHQPPTILVPILGPPDLETVQNKWLANSHVAKIISGNSQEIGDPSEFQVGENNIPYFWDEIKAITYDISKQLDYEALRTLGGQSPSALAKLALSWRAKLLKYELAIAAANEADKLAAEASGRPAQQQTDKPKKKGGLLAGM